METDGACALDDSVREWMNRVSNSGVDDQTSSSDTSDPLARSKRDSNGNSYGNNNNYRHNFWTTAFEAQGRIGPAIK